MGWPFAKAKLKMETPTTMKMILRRGLIVLFLMAIGIGVM